MEIKVSEIPPEGISGVELEETVEDIGSGGDSVKFLAPVKTRLSLKKTGAVVTLEGEVVARTELVCARCGKPFKTEAKSGFLLDLAPLESLGEAEERELHEGDLEVEFYEGDTINLSDFVREQALLQIPMKPLCRDDCRGLCQYCGADKNEADCGCAAPSGHPGLAGLKDLLKDK